MTYNNSEGNMSKQITFSNFLNKLEEFENTNAIWYSDLLANGRQALLSVYNTTENEQLINLTESFTNFISLLALCHPNSSVDEKYIMQTSKKHNESQELLPKKDVINMVNSDLQCPICNEWLYRATSANCNHTFCETCINKWLKMNKACPICRTSIEYTSTSIAVDNFITNLCQLIGGFIKERRESIEISRIDYNKNQTTINLTTYEEINDSIINQSIVEDTYISELDITMPMTHPNMVRLMPCPQSPQTPSSTVNVRQPIVNSGVPHPNTVRLIPFPPSSAITRPRFNHPQPTFLTPAINPRVDYSQVTSSTPVCRPNVHLRVNTNTGSSTRYHSNISRLSPFQTSSSPRTNNVRRN